MTSDLDLDRPVQTRDGRAVRILCRDAKKSQPIVGLVACADGEERVSQWCDDGGYYESCAKSDNDLINTPAPPEPPMTRAEVRNEIAAAIQSLMDNHGRTDWRSSMQNVVKEFRSHP